MTAELLFHATALSSFALAFDKYTRVYDKARLPRCTYPNEFYLLRRDELEVGLDKAAALVLKLGITGDQVVVLQTEVGADELQPHPRAGKGRFVARGHVKVRALFEAAGDGLLELPVEEALARAVKALNPTMASYADLVPRTLSVLPIARACQASCVFCFSEASASSEQPTSVAFRAQLEAACQKARARGAERFVITGGGEPGLLGHQGLLELIATGQRHFGKTVLITNGVHLARLDEEQRQRYLADYAAAGLCVLSISRHHHDSAVNESIMRLDTRTERVLESVSTLALPAGNRTKPRLTCVLQKGGVDSEESLLEYLEWAGRNGVVQVCFKELYVSTTLESAYHANPANQWSLLNQVPLALVVESLLKKGFKITSRLPWGAPVLKGRWRGYPLEVAAYTEPSLFWERTHGLVRSWNLMADGSCLASLEDPGSSIVLGEGQHRARKTIPLRVVQ